MAATQLIEDMQSLPFSEMIGGPLSACIEAQEKAALTTVDFIRNVGFAKKEATVNGQKTLVPGDEVINVTFMYKRENQMVELTVPLLTIVPIPYIAIDTVNINFKANMKMTQRESAKQREAESDYQRQLETNKSNSAKLGWGSVSRDKSYSSSYASVSTKKDSVATQNSQYSVEATIDVNVVAHQESMPAGMSKVLEMLNQAIFLESTDKDDQIKRLQAQIEDLEKAKAAEKAEAEKVETK